MRSAEPIFLTGGAVRRARTLCRDFVNFTLTLVFYLACWLIGGAAFMLDNMFSTRLFDRFLRLAEYVDNGGR